MYLVSNEVSEYVSVSGCTCTYATAALSTYDGTKTGTIYITSLGGVSSTDAATEIAECARILVDFGAERVTINIVNAKGGSVSSASAVLESLFAPNAFPLAVAGTSLAARNYVCDSSINPYTAVDTCLAASAFYTENATDATVCGTALNVMALPGSGDGDGQHWPMYG
ncbi:hypothetical protein KIPB_011910 [Kipferlia bialata]|uniref:Uncharacterized protein n=1 Tax=Kipferlia bialata TaxID=797122 RepID=A0A9K3GNI7_9EUKA|nr:hypothetical protein KIPB_011910 [Kipferlia bialata]|eukprot:g11910.t1